MLGFMNWRYGSTAACTNATAHAHSTSDASAAQAKRGDDGVVEPDQRIVFIVLALGMLLGALMTSPSKTAPQVQPEDSRLAAELPSGGR